MGFNKVVKWITSPIAYCLLFLILFTAKFQYIYSKIGSLCAIISFWSLDPTVLEQTVENHNRIAIVLICQTGEYWENTARSVLAQSYPNAEIIVLNNAIDDPWFTGYREYMTRFGNGESIKCLSYSSKRDPIEIFQEAVNSLEESTIVVPLFIGDWIVERTYLYKLDRIFTYYSPHFTSSKRLVYLPQHKNQVAEENVLKSEAMLHRFESLSNVGVRDRSGNLQISKNINSERGIAFRAGVLKGFNFEKLMKNHSCIHPDLFYSTLHVALNMATGTEAFKIPLIGYVENQAKTYIAESELVTECIALMKTIQSGNLARDS